MVVPAGQGRNAVSLALAHVPAWQGTQATPKAFLMGTWPGSAHTVQLSTSQAASPVVVRALGQGQHADLFELRVSPNLLQSVALVPTESGGTTLAAGQGVHAAPPPAEKDSCLQALQTDEPGAYPLPGVHGVRHSLLALAPAALVFLPVEHLVHAGRVLPPADQVPIAHKVQLALP